MTDFRHLPTCPKSGGKFIHATKTSAQTQIDSLAQAGKGGAWAYLCPGTSHWHVTHKGLSPTARRMLRNTIKIGRAKAGLTTKPRKR